MAPVELAEAPKELLNKWVAIEDSTSLIIGFGDTVEEAEEAAQGKNKEEYYLFFLAPCTGGFLL